MQLLNTDIVGFVGNHHIKIERGKISNVSRAQSAPLSVEELTFDCEGALVFPGLTNSHDHLDFDLFPALGNRIYNNYVEWGADIHASKKDEIAAVLRVPEQYRVQWGIYKNLIAGVTTVIHHGKRVVDYEELINVYQQAQSIHSIQRERYWLLKLNNLININRPAVLHIGEGIDETSFEEIRRLLRANFLKRSLIGVHGIAMNERQAQKFSALVWCPLSNYFLFGKTAQIDLLKKNTTILFGTDSTLTGNWNIWEHLRFARAQNLLSDAELFESIQRNATAAWKIRNTHGIKEGQWADVVIAKRVSGRNKWDQFFNLNPKDILLILHRGNIRLIDPLLVKQVKRNRLINAGFSRIYIQNSLKYVQGNMADLIKKVGPYSEAIPLGID